MNRGFSLIETIIALSILIVGILAGLTLTQRSVQTSKINEDVVIAVNLAREGIELVRAIRDSRNLGFSTLVDGDYIVDTDANFNISTQADSSDVKLCNNCRLYFMNGKYVHNQAGSPTIFRRMVNISSGSNLSCGGVCEKIVTVYVFREGSPNPYKLVVHLTNWR